MVEMIDKAVTDSSGEIVLVAHEAWLRYRRALGKSVQTAHKSRAVSCTYRRIASDFEHL